MSYFTNPKDHDEKILCHYFIIDRMNNWRVYYVFTLFVRPFVSSPCDFFKILLNVLFLQYLLKYYTQKAYIGFVACEAISPLNLVFLKNQVSFLPATYFILVFVGFLLQKVSEVSRKKTLAIFCNDFF